MSRYFRSLPFLCSVGVLLVLCFSIENPIENRRIIKLLSSGPVASSFFGTHCEAPKEMEEGAAEGVLGFCLKSPSQAEKEGIRILLPKGDEIGPSAAPIHNPDDTFLLKKLEHLLVEGCRDYTISSCGALQEYGFGAMLNGMVKSASLAVSSNQSFYYRDLEGIWSGGGPAAKKNLFQKFFPKLPCSSACSLNSTISNHRTIYSCRTISKRKKKCSHSSIPYPIKDLLPPTCSPLWWSGGVLHHLLKGHNISVQTTMALLNITPDSYPMLGVHIRHGDSCNGILHRSAGRQCDAISVYVPMVNFMVKRYGYKSIFVATDNNELKDLLKKGGVGKVFTVPVFTPDWEVPVFRDASRNLTAIEHAAPGSFDPLETGLQFITETLLLAKCQGFVGKFTSNFFRNAYALSSHDTVSKGICLKPVISLDSPMCMDFAVRGGTNCQTGERFYC
eukprot:TRINITY_DN20105_c0_g1_i1.p1 TRINITY_DN20105_c0_g1~~TRINITY_DN20105_c0_g1_i1.p1  ORF type:complete len:447 (+),score=43.91 TRINITY_DN20105_c0_g1_i1:86-1426(+)